jgi:hypothetical protein
VETIMLRTSLLAAILLCAAQAHSAQPFQIQPLQQKETPVSHHAEGPFDVKSAPLAADGVAIGTSLGRFSLDKHYHGALDAAAKGEMLAYGNPAIGEAGYVALEEITGTLDGRKGTFALQHWGTMHAGKFELRVEIVPGSGTGELAGIAGSLSITIAAGGKHSYALDYTLPAAAAPSIP